MVVKKTSTTNISQREQFYQQRLGLSSADVKDLKVNEENIIFPSFISFTLFDVKTFAFDFDIKSLHLKLEDAFID